MRQIADQQSMPDSIRSLLKNNDYVLLRNSLGMRDSGRQLLESLRGKTKYLIIYDDTGHWHADDFPDAYVLGRWYLECY